MEKQCGHCARPFSCAQAAECWCGAVKLDQAQLAWVKQKFHDCLCPSCLAAVAAGTLYNKETP
ncbi:MAG: cysteine-rich CWC family protein [Nitrospirae bacterium]|nr:cysteine-rich CWC family protein [Nitrospirota bacterium]